MRAPLRPSDAAEQLEPRPDASSDQRTSALAMHQDLAAALASEVAAIRLVGSLSLSPSLLRDGDEVKVQVRQLRLKTGCGGRLQRCLRSKAAADQ